MAPFPVSSPRISASSQTCQQKASRDRRHPLSAIYIGIPQQWVVSSEGVLQRIVEILSTEALEVLASVRKRRQLVRDSAMILEVLSPMLERLEKMPTDPK
jgi:hypothetical protein